MTFIYDLILLGVFSRYLNTAGVQKRRFRARGSFLLTKNILMAMEGMNRENNIPVSLLKDIFNECRPVWVKKKPHLTWRYYDRNGHLKIFKKWDVHVVN